ncbi:DUF6094 domain-containing protein [Nitrogeniibacter aestuarii]|uniref:DUF6094 domain-containing protein n=1 Tax=Nitrogeniibacter aestuarii TaxID=2815343 RepID=UPI001E5FCBFC|nr:DUF6094 domain-containing protein [Nitrogeniibacter aestuarii]
MALIFPRLARNFIKASYFPTDMQTLEGIASMLDPSTSAKVRMFDPCCGEGSALRFLADGFRSEHSDVETLGVEYDAQRAYHSKEILDRVVHSDIHDVTITPNSVSLLFLNPPYGAVVNDGAMLEEKTKQNRLEKVFYGRTVRSLMPGGVLVLIVPHYVIDEDFANKIATGFSRVQFFMAPEQEFKQCVIFGVRDRKHQPDPAIRQMLLAAACGEGNVRTLTPDGLHEPYPVPSVPDARIRESRFFAQRLDANQVTQEIEAHIKMTMWPQFDARFSRGALGTRRPLKALGPWHLALALAAGFIAGIVESNGRRLLIKGDTVKTKDRKVEFSEDDDGNVSETITLTDRFVPAIRGIDLTPGSESRGAIITVK